MGINERLLAKKTAGGSTGTGFSANGINARLNAAVQQRAAAQQKEEAALRAPTFSASSQYRNGAFGGGTDFLSPMREEIDLASALVQTERELAAEKNARYYDTSKGQAPSWKTRKLFPSPEDTAVVSGLEEEADDLRDEFQRRIYEGAAEGKTVERRITEEGETRVGSLLPSPYAGKTVSAGWNEIPVEHMSEKERATYDYLYSLDRSMASKYGQAIREQVNERAAGELAEGTEQLARDYKPLGVAINLGASFTTPLAALGAAGSKITGQPYDPNSPANYGAIIASASQEGLTGDIENSFGKFLADTGLSTAQFLSKLPLGPQAALAVMSSGAAGQTAYDARKSGASTDEALTLGVIAGAAEAALEKIPLDDVMKAFKGAASSIGAKFHLNNVLKPWMSAILGTSLEEGGEEIVTEYINNLADLAIRGDQGEMAQYKQELIASGMSEAEADKQAKIKFWITDPVLSFAGGALSGGALSGIGQVSGAAGRKIQSAVAKRRAKKQAEADAAAKVQQETATAGADTTAQEIFEDPEAEAAELDDILEAEEAEQAREWAAEDRAEEERTAAQETREGIKEDENLVRARTVLDDGVLPTAVTAERQRRAQTAKTDTERSGILAGASDADITLAQTISRAFGRKVIFASDDMRYNGKAKNGVITVNLKSGGVASQTLAHELMHTLEPYGTQYGGLVKVLRDMVAQRAGSMYLDPADSTKNRKWETWEELRQKVYAQGYEKVYAGEGRRFTEADADYEVAANLIAELFENSQTLEEFVRANRNIAVRIWTKVKTFARRAKALITRERAVGSAGDALRLAGYYDQIASMFADSLRRTKYRTRQMSARAAKAGGEKFSFAGVGRDGVREYFSDFPPDMSIEERTKIFRDRISTVFNLGMVRLNTDTKKITVTADRFTVTKNIGGDTGSSEKGYAAKISSLYDLADMLATSEYSGKKPERSYDPNTNAPREKVPPKNKAHKGVKYWYYFSNNVRIDGIEYSILFNIRDKGKEQLAYLVEMNEKTAPEANSTRTANRYSLQSSFDRVPSDTIISDNRGNVNTSGEKYSLPDTTLADIETEHDKPINTDVSNTSETERAAKKADYYEEIATRFGTALAKTRRGAEKALQAGDKGERFSFAKEAFTYDVLISKPDMPVTTVDDSVKYPNNSEGRKQLVRDAIENAKRVGYTNAVNNAVIHVADSNTDIIVGSAGIRHGLDRRFDVIAPVAQKIGEILQNAVVINELNPRQSNISNSYVLAGMAKNSRNEPYTVLAVVNRYTNEVSEIDVLYSMNTKTQAIEKNRPGAVSPGVAAHSADYLTDSTISIAHLLELVNRYFPDILPMDVQRHFGRTERPAGKIGESVKYSLPDTTLADIETEHDKPINTDVSNTSEAERAARRAKKAEREAAKVAANIRAATGRPPANAEADTTKDAKPKKAPRPKKMSWNDMVAEVAERVAPKIYTAYQKRSLRDDILALYDKLDSVQSPEDYARIKGEAEAFAMDKAEELTADNRQEIPGRAEVRDDIKAALRQPIMVSEEAKRDFNGRYGEFFRANMGRLGLRNAGRGIDSVYGELSEQYPEWFPSDIETQGDQLRQFAKVWEMVDREDFVSESIYDVTGGEEAMLADQKRIARTILDGYTQLRGVARSESERMQDELAAAKRKNKAGYDARLDKIEAEYAAKSEESRAVYQTEIAKARDEGRAAVEAERGKWKEKDAKRRKAEADRKRAAQEKKRQRGGFISLDKVRDAIKSGTYTAAMQKLYDELHELEKEFEPFAGVDPISIEDAEYLENLIERIDNKKEYIRKAGAASRRILREEAADFLRSADVAKWKDKPAGLMYSIQTMQRNIERISGFGEAGREMYDKYFRPIAEHNADATRLKNDVRSRVSKLNLAMNVTGRNHLSESAMVQLLGEARDNIYMLENHQGYTTRYDGAEHRSGMTLEEWRDVENTLLLENPDMDMAKINRAIEEFQKIYDSLFESINATRLANGYPPISYRHGYFPHYTTNTVPDGLLATLAKGLGFEVDLDGLPTPINGLTARRRPGIQYQNFANRRSENPGEAYNGIRLDGMGAVEGIDRYIEVAANVIFLTGDVQKLRALSDGIRFVTTSEEIQNQVKEIRKNKELEEDEKQAKIDLLYEEGKYSLRNFVVELEEYTNLLAGKKSFNDRNAEQFLGRGIYDLTKKLEQRLGANMVGLNIGSWLSNLIPLTQAGAVISNRDMLNAMWETMAAIRNNDGFVGHSTFLVNRVGSERLVKTLPTSGTRLGKINYRLNKLQEVVPDGMGAVDAFASQTIVRARYNENISKGMSEESAMQEADEFASRLMGDRSRGQMPTIFSQQNPITKLFTQFQLEVANQLSWTWHDLRHIYSDSRKKFAAELLKLAFGGFLWNFVMKALTGRDSASDPIGLLNDTVGDLTGRALPDLTDIPRAIQDQGWSWDALDQMTRKEQKGFLEGLGNLGTNLAEELPFVGGLIGGGRLPVSSAMVDITKVGGALGSLREGNTKKGVSALYKEAAKPLFYLAAPFGGGQVKKTVEGIEAIARGGSYSYDSKDRESLQYPLYRDTPAEAIWNSAKTLVFGKTSTSAAQDWIESGFQGLSGKKTEAYQNAIKAGASQREAFAAVNAIKGETVTEKRAALASMELDDTVKASYYYDLLATDKEKETMDALGKDGKVYKALTAIRDKTGNLSAKVDILSRAGLSDSQAATVLANHISPAYADKLAAARSAGVAMSDFLTAYKKKLATTGEQAKAEVLKYINQMDLTKAQKDALYLCFYQPATLSNAPWNRLFPNIELPEISLPEIDIDIGF